MGDMNYSSWGDDAAKQDAKTAAGRDTVEIMKFKEGRTVLRFLPPQVGKNSPFEVVWQHYIETPDGKRLVFPCPLKTHRAPCPICDEANRLSKTGNPADREAAYQYWPKMRVFAEVVDLDDIGKGVQIVAFGKTIYEQLMSIRTDRRLGGDFTDPEDGFDIIVDRSGSGLQTRYSVRSDKQSTGPLEDWNWLDDRKDLDRFSVAAPNKTLEDAREAVGLPPSGIIDAEMVPTSRRLSERTIADDIG